MKWLAKLKAEAYVWLALIAAMLILALPATAADPQVYSDSNPALSLNFTSQTTFSNSDVFYDGQDLFRPGEDLDFSANDLQELGPVWRAQDVSPDVSGESVSGQASASTTYWWYFYKGQYRVLMPGTATGPYSSYYRAAGSIAPYMPSAYTTASAVLGLSKSNYIDAYLWYDSGRSAVGWYYNNSNAIYLNLAHSGTASYFGSVASHETTHLLFDQATHLVNRDPVAESWVTEAFAWYVGSTVYPYGSRYGYSYNSQLLDYYSNNGAIRATWYGSGARYNHRGTSVPAYSIDYVQMQTIGYFLAHSSKGWSAIQETVRYLMRGYSIDSAFSSAYGGLKTGQHSTASGPSVNTLYSKYLNYYLGHY